MYILLMDLAQISNPHDLDPLFRRDLDRSKAH